MVEWNHCNMAEHLASNSWFTRAVQRKIGRFFPILFSFFVVQNITCYWSAIYTAFPHFMMTHEASHYLKLQIPVGLVGALSIVFLFSSPCGLFAELQLQKKFWLYFPPFAWLGHCRTRNPVGIVCIYSWWLVDKLVEGVHRTLGGTRIYLHQSYSSSTSGTNRRSEIKEHLLWINHGSVHSSSHFYI